MKQIIVGSTALKYHGLTNRTPSDLDIWVDCKHHNLSGDISVIDSSILSLIPTIDGYASPEALYTIKCSHLGWESPNWDRHKDDLLLLKSKGYKLIPELYKLLQDKWKKEFGDIKHLNLGKTKEEFFNDNVTYIYDHDYLHELVSYPDEPVYKSCLKDNHEVMIDKHKFDMLDFDDKVKMFREEITVIACERWVINPYWKGTISWYRAYILSLRKTITNLTKGWATNFIVENLESFIKPEYSYFEYLLQQLESNMGNVNSLGTDLSPFVDFLEKVDKEVTLSRLVYLLCSDDVEVDELYELTKSYSDCEDKYWEEFETLNDKFLEETEYRLIEQDGGGEGGAEYCYSVFKFMGKTYKAEYSYYSYHGYSYDDVVDTLKEVKPVEKTITVYE